MTTQTDLFVSLAYRLNSSINRMQKHLNNLVDSNNITEKRHEIMQGIIDRKYQALKEGKVY